MVCGAEAHAEYDEVASGSDGVEFEITHNTDNGQDTTDAAGFTPFHSRLLVHGRVWVHAPCDY